jgi:hypothetical protein
MTRSSLRAFEVVVTGAFLTGQPLQVPVAESSSMQEALGEALRQRANEGWTYDPLEWQDAGGSYDGAGGYPSLVPLVLVSREGESLRRAVQDAFDHRPGPERQWVARLTAGWRWAVTDVSIDIFDFGTGIVRCACSFEPPESADAEEVRRIIDLLSRLKPDIEGQVQPPLAAALEAATRTTVFTLAEEIDRTVAHARQLPWLAPMVGALGDPVASGATAIPQRQYGWGRLLWLHPIFVLSAPRDSSADEVDAIARPFKSDFHRCLDISYGLFAPGIEISVIVGRGSVRARETFLWLISVNWAYYALFMEIDRGLLATLDDERWRTHATLAELERDAGEMFAVRLRVQTVHARLGSILMDIGGGALTLWDAIVEAQRFDALVTSVQVKVDLLQRVAEQRVADAAAARARRTGNILRGLSALTLVTVSTAVVSAVVGSRSDAGGHMLLRVAAIIGAVLLAALLFMIQRDVALRRERRRRLARRLARRRATAPRAPGTGTQLPRASPATGSPTRSRRKPTRG